MSLLVVAVTAKGIASGEAKLLEVLVMIIKNLAPSDELRVSPIGSRVKVCDPCRL